MYIQGKLLSYNDGFTEAYQIRRKVFIEEQGIPEEQEFDGLDKEAIHAIAYETDTRLKEREYDSCKRAVATGRITFDGEDCRIGHVAVLREYRGKEYGDFIVKMLLNKAFSSGIKEVAVNTQITAEGFYKKIGFYKAGENYMKDGREHCKMKINDINSVRKCYKNSKLYGV